jgi:hypothetical protein
MMTVVFGQRMAKNNQIVAAFAKRLFRSGATASVLNRVTGSLEHC